VTLPDRLASLGVGTGVFLVYLLTFSSVPTSDGLAFVAMLDEAIATGKASPPLYSNAPFGYYVPFLLKRLALSTGVSIPTLWILQGLNAGVTAVGCIAFYRAVRLVGGAPFWAALATLLVATSYGVWYFANGEVHHVGLALLLVLFERLLWLRGVPGERPRYATLAGLGFLNALAVFFHQEHFLFGCVAAALLLVGRPSPRAVREICVYGLAGTAGTFLLIFLTGWFGVGARSIGAVLGWYFWQLGYLVHDYTPEPVWVMALRLVKGQLTAFVFGVQAAVDAVRDQALRSFGTVRLLVGLTVVTLGLTGGLASTIWSERRRVGGDLRAMLAGALVWLLMYPVVLAWYFPAVTEYYLKTVPALVLLLVVGPIARERAGFPSGWRRPAAVVLLLLVVVGNAFAAIVPWYRYGRMRERLGAIASATFHPGDLAVSLESGLEAVFAGRVDQRRVKDLLYREGKARGFETIRSEIASRLERHHRVFVHNLAPSKWALQGLNEPVRNPYRDRYEARDFEELLAELGARYELIPVLTYWEEAKEPLYLFGRRLEALLEVRRRV